MQKTRLYIQGMTCISCETIINNELRDVDGLQKIKTSCRTGITEIEHNDKFNIKQAVKIVEKIGYQCSTEPLAMSCTMKKSATPQQWFTSVLVVVVLYLAYRILSNLGAFSWLNIDPSNINLGMALLVGVVASMSTCLMVVGAVVISFSAKYKSKGVGFYQTTIKPQLIFHFGRLITFFLFGGLLGSVGSWFQLSENFISWFTVAIAIVLLWLGLNILGLAPSLTKYGLHLPRGIMKHWHRLESSDKPWTPFILGGLTFFLPCGFTQSMQLFAISSGSFMTGAYTLLLFAVGTIPVLFGLGVATTKFSNLKTVVFEKAIGFIIIIFSIFVMSNGFAMSGINLDFWSKQDVGKVVGSEQEQVIEMDITYSGFSPNTFELKKGVPVRWIINGVQVSGCTNEIIVPELGIKQKVKLGENIVNFTADKVGKINFSCWMGMVKGQFIVVD